MPSEPTEGRRFWLVDDPASPYCAPGGSDCILRASIRGIVQTDEGEVEIASGEHALVTVEGETFVAIVSSAHRSLVVEPDCGDDVGGGIGGSAYLARTTALPLTLAERADPPVDDCPALMPLEGDACSTIADRQCEYEWGGGCLDTYECAGCYWRITLQSYPEGVDCGWDPDDCTTNGSDGACSEEDVCTDCSCPDPVGERWRCVGPGADCPACE